MRLKDCSASILRKFRIPATWGAIIAYGLVWATLRFFLFTDMPSLLSPLAELVLPFLLVMGHVALAPLSWLWTGDERAEAPLFRGMLQTLPWNTLWLGLLMGLVVAVDPTGKSHGQPTFQLHLRAHALPLSPIWGIFFLNYPLALIMGWFLAGKERVESSARELRGLANRARAQALQAQLNPHTLVNVIGGLTELVHEDPDAAEEALVALAEMYRALMEHGASLTSPLARERALVGRYLAIEEIRLGSRLSVEWAWPAWADALELPPLLLQPLVENAIKHGISPSIQGGVVRIEALQTLTGLTLRVANTGEPLHADHPIGVGLGNLGERLALFSTLQPSFRLEQEGGWTVAMLSLAWRWPS